MNGMTKHLIYRRKECDRKMKAIDMKELIIAMKELEDERGIKKEYLIESLEMALVTAYKKEF